MGSRGANSGLNGVLLQSISNVAPVARVPAKSLSTDGITVYNADGSPNIDKTIARWSEEHVGQDHEFALYLDADGNALGYYEGEANSIYIPESIAVRGYDPYRIVTLHNHPLSGSLSTGGTFSDEDIYRMLKDTATETIIVANEGTYRFAMTMDADPDGLRRALSAATTRYLKVATSRYDISTDNGEEQAILYLQRKFHAWYSDNAERFGYEYEYKKRKE